MKQVFLDTLSLDEARRKILASLEGSGLSRMPEEVIRVADSCGRVTSRAVFARYSSPFFHSAAMDGYAVRFGETFSATETTPILLKLGEQARYVDTGDPMPEGFNAVIMIEDVNLAEGAIEIYAPVTPYQHVRPIGEDIVATELIIPENHVIRPIDIGAMLASGHLDVAVRKRPLVAVIPTGTEIIEPEVVRHRPPEPPEIIEYNTHVLGGLARELGADPVREAVVRDDLDTLTGAIGEALDRSDIVLVNAGSGRGTEDFTAAAIARLGELLVHGVSMKPGKPLIAGVVRGKPVFGIPGYPVSAYLTFRCFVEPVIRTMLGVAEEEAQTIGAVLSRQVASVMGVDEFIRVKVGVVGGRHIATPVGRGAGLLMSLVRADGIVRIPAECEALSAGAEVRVSLLRNPDEIGNTIVCIGSHDNTLDVLANVLKKTCPRLSLSSAHVGSMGGLMALKRGEAHIAGTHLLDEQSGEYNVPFLKKLFTDRKISLVNLVYRQQGLLVRRGNPKGVHGFEDLAREEVTFVNRQAGSGTRLLLDKHLRDKGIDPRRIRGYERDEFTHMAVASSVLTGLADAGLAVYSSAKALGLDFLPVAEERYDLAVPSEFLDMEKIGVLLRIIREDDEFRRTVESLGGYDTRDMGKVLYEG